MSRLISESHTSTKHIKEPQGEYTTRSLERNHPFTGKCRKRALVSSMGTKTTEGYMLNKAWGSFPTELNIDLLFSLISIRLLCWWLIKVQKKKKKNQAWLLTTTRARTWENPCLFSAEFFAWNHFSLFPASTPTCIKKASSYQDAEISQIVPSACTSSEKNVYPVHNISLHCGSSSGPTSNIHLMQNIN